MSFPACVLGGLRGAALGAACAVGELGAALVTGGRVPAGLAILVVAWDVILAGGGGAVLGLGRRPLPSRRLAALLVSGWACATLASAGIAGLAGVLCAVVLWRSPERDSAEGGGGSALATAGLVFGLQVAPVWGQAISGVLAGVVGLAWLATRGLRRVSAVVAVCLLAAATGGLVVLAGARRRAEDRSALVERTVGKPAAAQRPGLVLVVLDTVRASRLSLYGYSRATTPRLADFAREATVVHRAYSTSPSTGPSHASLFTGLLPTRHGLHGWPDASDRVPLLAPEADTLAERLAAAGYRTGAVVANFAQVAPRTGLDQGFTDFDARPGSGLTRLAAPPLIWRGRWHLPPALVLGPLARLAPRSYRPAREITDLALAWLRRTEPGTSFFLFVNYLEAHSPYAADEPFLSTWAPASGDGRFPPQGLSPTAVAEIERGDREPTLEEREHLARLYDASLADLDHHLGRLLDGLGARPDRDRTWVVITSDHGEALGDHGDLTHSTSLYDEQVRVPLLVRAPAGGQPPPPDRITSGVDLFPLLLQAAGLPVPEGIDGRSLDLPREDALAEVNPDGMHRRLYPRRRSAVAVVRGGHKLILGEDGRSELFDLIRDPGEQHDVAAVFPDLRDVLEARITAWRREAQAPARQGAPLDAEGREALRALGYLP